MVKIELLLATLDGASSDQSLQAALPTGNGVRVTAHDPALLSGLAHGDATESAPPFRYLVEVACQPEETASTIDWLRAGLDRVDGIDRARSAAVAGTEFTVVPGEEQITLGMALTRKPAMTHEAFNEYWRTNHAELGRTVPGSEGYRQVHIAPTLTDEVVRILGFGGPRFDGIALAYYSSQAAFEAIMANTEVTSALLADERQFIDHSRAAMIVGREPRPTS